jgi:electron transfer flavoprotein alpha/beta subunit
LKIIVLIKDVPDTKVPLECDESLCRLREEWNIPILNPDDAAALCAALTVRRGIPGARVTAVHLGPPSGARWIREAVAMGCDDGLRIWDENLEEVRTAGKVMIFSRVAEILGFDLIFTGTKSMDTAGGHLAVMLAASLQTPCVRCAIHIDEVRADALLVTRNLDRGYRERIEVSMPHVVAMEAEEENELYASLPAVMGAAERDIPCFDLSSIGIPNSALRQADSRLVFGPLRFPEPKLQYIQPPDSSLPAFERRRQIGEGLAAGREGKMVKGEDDAVAEEIFQTLLRQGWLNHLREDGRKSK